MDWLIDWIVFLSAQEYLRPYRDATVVSDESMLSTYDVLAVRDLNRVAHAATPTFLLWGLIRRTAQISRLYDKSGIPRSSSYPFSMGLPTCKLNNTTTSFQTWKNDKKRTLKCFHSVRKQKKLSDDISIFFGKILKNTRSSVVEKLGEKRIDSFLDAERIQLAQWHNSKNELQRKRWIPWIALHVHLSC